MKIPLAVCVVFLAGARVVAQQADIGPAPGRLIDIGGRKLHLDCSGSGSPTVILEAGASAFALDWSLVQPEIARTNRVCSYDRAGSGWSDPRNDVDTPARIVSDLHSVLAAAGEKPPFVMAGASFGAIYVRIYQLEHPDEVVGLVLVDPATEDRLFIMFHQEVVTIGSLTADQLRSTLPGTGSVPVRSRSPQTGAPFDLLSPSLYQLRIKLDQRLIASVPSKMTADDLRESSEGQRAALARLLESRAKQEFPIGDRPLVVLTRGQEMTPGIAENHAGLARLSTNSRHTVVPAAGHEIHLFAPSAVIQAIQDVSIASQHRSKLPARP
jgi:pimeloyl-ACP methyl ester carboxylesterase